MNGRHRDQRRQPVGQLMALSAALALIAVLGWVVVQRTVGASCDGGGSITVAVTPELVDAVRQTVADTNSKRPADARCVGVDVTAAEPADVAATFANARGATFGSGDQADAQAPLPDVWIADSSTWLQRLRATGVDVGDDATSVARSPVVLATLEPIAKNLGWTSAKVDWGQVLGAATKSQVRLGSVEPNRDATALSALMALDGAAAASGPEAQQSTIAVTRSLAQRKATSRRDLTAKFPRETDPAKLATTQNAAALPEYAVIAYNAAEPPTRLTAVYPDPVATSLDYPFVVLSGQAPAAPAKIAAAKALKSALSGPDWQNRLASHGLRAADGRPGAGFRAPTGAPEVVDSTPQPPDTTILTRVLSTWTALTRPGRALIVMDVSGSMATPVPTAGGATRQQVAVAAVRKGMRLVDDAWQLGLWAFSTQLDGPNDHRQLSPIAPLSEQRGELESALDTITPKRNGQTGLYDTALAAYTAVLADWAPGRVNSMIIVTDGQNEDPQGISMDQLVDGLRRAADPSKPVEAIIVGIGPEVNKAELSKITSAIGGGVFVTTDPAQIGGIFLQAIALRTRT